ncbi:MAG TPA: ribbon-helix-helix protein, CopG family [Polyangiaceae bacterium]|jgi:predicted transcriptional regulator|nr:ribbon-helix-helix protein, CopG family [Polyangiaceae bacterium]
MATTVHIPGALLRRVDERAKALGISRNRLIVEAVEAKLVTRHRWPPELRAMLAQPLDAASARAFEASLAIVRKRRQSRKRAPKL